jgi:hypothetical protein
MTSFLRTRLHRSAQSAQDGVYAVLYSVLVVVLLAMGAIVVDLASVRQDRRIGRSATDSAVLGGAALLNPQAVGGGTPYKACLRAWDYLALTLKIGVPSGACGAFASYDTTGAVGTCSAAGSQPAEIADDRTVGNRTFRVAWPIPRTGGSGFLNPDIAPGNVTQTYAPGIDGPLTGNDYGCDRLGVAMFENATFGLGGAVGVSGTSTQVHSVARFNPTGGPAEEVAALNVLEKTDCPTLRVTGGGKAVVGPTIDSDGNVVGPGIIAVESTGLGSSCKSSTTVITLNGTGTSLCAAASALNSDATNCDGAGVIRSYALDSGGYAYLPSDVSGGMLRPQPTLEGGTYGWDPVTKLYGCESLSPCTLGGTNYIDALRDALGGSGAPGANYAGSVSPYNEPFTGGFTDVSAYFCPNKPTALPAGGFLPGNHYVGCDIDITGGKTVVFQGGTLVVNGGLTVSSGCFVMNAANCTPTISNAGKSTASITPAPTRDAIVYLRGDDLAATETCTAGSQHHTLLLPQTFVFQAASATSLNVKTTCDVFWTAPGAGAVTAGRTTLEDACFVATPAPGAVSQECLKSRFSRLAYWSEYPAPSNKPDNFGGQGQLSLVGVFFTPRAFLNLTGGSGYSAASAQFWARYLDINGIGTLALSPDTRSSIATPTGRVALIR